MSHGARYAGTGLPIAERVQRRRDEAAILIAALGRLLDIWVTPNELQWDADFDTPDYLHRGVHLSHTSLVFEEGEAPVDYLQGALQCECGGYIRSAYISTEEGVTALREGRDPIAVEFHDCIPKAIRELGGSCPECAHHPLCGVGPHFTSCWYCGFQLSVEDGETVERVSGAGTYLIRLHTDEHTGAIGRFVTDDDRERWTSEVQASGTAARAYFTHNVDGVWQTTYAVGSPEAYDWISPAAQVPGPEEEPVAWPA